MNGSEILSEVRILIKDMGYGRYNEINRAYRNLGRLCHHNWLRSESQDMLTFLDGESDYWIDLTGIRVLKRIWVKGNDSGKIFWHEMDEVPSQTFETYALENIEPDGSNREARPCWYKIIDTSAQSLKIQVTPVPDETYYTKVEYIRDLEEITPLLTPSMPESYQDLIADMAAGLVLQRSDDVKERQRGMELVAKARNDAVNGLVKDAHANRTHSISPRKRRYNEFI